MRQSSPSCGRNSPQIGVSDLSYNECIPKPLTSRLDVITLGYISDIVAIVHGFTQTLLSAICEDKRVRQGIKDVLLDELIERYRKSIEHTKFILSVERSGTPLTANHYFTDNLEKNRNARTKANLQKNAIWDQTGQVKVVNLDAVQSSATNSSNEKQHVDEIHDILKAYYKVARKRFVDVICMQAADHYLVNGPDAPIKVFSPSFVGSLSQEQLQAIAGEDLATKRKRADLERQKENLTIGKRIA